LNSFSKNHDFNYSQKTSFYEQLPSVKKGGTLYFSMSSDPKVINPLLSADNESASLEGYLWLPLMTLNPETIEFLPALATGYSISADKKNFTFFINPKAKWQDGTDVTADDIRFSFDTLMNTKTDSAALRSYFHGTTLSVKDPHTVTFSVADPKFDSLYVLSSFATIQKKQFEHSPNFNLDKGIMKPVGNGPYVLEKYERTQQVVFKRNKSWWGYSIPHFKERYNVDKIVIRIIGDQSLAYEKFIADDLDMIAFTQEQWHINVNGIDKNKFGKNRSSGKPIWSVKEENQFPRVYDYIGWNEKNPIFADPKTRLALSYLVDYKKIINAVYYDLSVQCTSPFGSFSNNSDPELRMPGKMISFDKLKAMKLLKEAGWKNEGGDALVKVINGKKVPFVFELATVSTNKARVKIATILKEDFKDSGIQLKIRAMEWNSFLDRVDKQDFDAVILGWTATLFQNPKQIWDSKSADLGGSNYISYSNPQVDKLIEKANVEFDASKRNKIMQQLNRLIYADQPYTFLTEPKAGLFGLNSKIKSPRWYSKYDSALATDLFYLN
jgi:ABC-type transport system substrate-binding protein